MQPESVAFRLEFDMRYGNQRVETAVATKLSRITSPQDVLSLIREFHERYGERFGEGSQATESGVRINTIRVTSYVKLDKVRFHNLKPLAEKHAVQPVGARNCHFVGHDQPVNTPLFDEKALQPGAYIEGPAVVTTRATTFLVEPGWSFHASNYGAVWFTRLASN